MPFSSLSRPYLIWICAAFFYVYQFVLRVSPSLIVDDLMLFFQMDSSGVASLSAVAMYSYALMQIPAGLLVDAFGVRTILLISVVLCLTGISVFACSQHLILAKLGRLLLGTGSASAFLCVGKISMLWFPVHRRATLLGMTMAMGTVGAYFGSIGLSFLISNLGWKNSLLWTNALGILALGAAFFTIPNRKREVDQLGPTNGSGRAVIKHLVDLVGSRPIWLYSITALGIYLCISVIADLWGVSFVMEAHGISKIEATQMVSLMYVGLCFGSLFLTFLADLLQARQGLIQLSIALLLLFASCLIYYPFFPKPILGTLFFIIGFLGGAEMLCFSKLCELVGRSASGTATGFMNCIVMLGGALVVEQVGKLLDTFWQGNLHSSGIRVYTVSEYQMSLTLVVVVLLISTLVSAFLPRTVTNSSEEASP